MIKQCNHVKANGLFCDSPALRNEKYCYFHLAARDRIRRQAEAARAKRILQLPVLEDRETIQLALGDVANALLADRIDVPKAGLILYALQTASHNTRPSFFYIGEESRYLSQFVPEPDNSLDPPPPKPPAPAPKSAAQTRHEAAVAALLRECASRA